MIIGINIIQKLTIGLQTVLNKTKVSLDQNKVGFVLCMFIVHTYGYHGPGIVVEGVARCPVGMVDFAKLNYPYIGCHFLYMIGFNCRKLIRKLQVVA